MSSELLEGLWPHAWHTLPALHLPLEVDARAIVTLDGVVVEATTNDGKIVLTRPIALSATQSLLITGLSEEDREPALSGADLGRRRTTGLL